ncbi:hypothetical protein KP77_15980 [Jeotgalibacillus alimentarius]|uniref:Uncharacterized protein n=1 Tax=Jeotgalibacillus alimentarius TaxID=135826 RepID=A0A0C2W287_9BACL|nr:hypothetical protein [Jeotgalibacillus alimentarius]KIL50223.1 hypothetical protein KP77_15980 [Jeotgalibacillus alimentarius]
MGYIAPVNQLQYQQYAERVTMKDYDPYYLTPVQRVNPLRRSDRDFEEELEQEMDKREKKRETEFKSGDAPIFHIQTIPPHLIPKVTGKGQNFNASI